MLRSRPLAVDTRTVVWVSTAEKIIPGETRKYSRKFGGFAVPALYKNLAVNIGQEKRAQELAFRVRRPFVGGVRVCVEEFVPSLESSFVPPKPREDKLCPRDVRGFFPGFPGLRWPDSRESFRGSRTEPLFCESRFGGLKNCETQV